MDLPHNEEERLLQEADLYLVELASRVGEPSAKHLAQAKAIVQSIKESHDTGIVE